jgi:hypothetical protein
MKSTGTRNKEHLASLGSLPAENDYPRTHDSHGTPTNEKDLKAVNFG